MSSVLHPIGPEPSQTYWVRRVLVIAAVVAVTALLVAVIANATGTGTATSADPPVNPAPQGETGSPTPSPTPGGLATSPSASPTASGSTTPTASASTDARSPSASSSPTATDTATATPAGTPDCEPGELRPTLTGSRTLKPKQATTFRLSLINGGAQTCLLEVHRGNFELKIYSGRDRIWSSDDCSRAVKSLTAKLDSEEAVEWTMAWDGRRSRKDCQQRPEIPRPGTYFATAQFDGAKPVQLRMTLTG